MARRCSPCSAFSWEALSARAARRAAAAAASGAAAAAGADGDDFGGVLARYRKMCKLGVPPASVRQRMGLDQVDARAIAAFSREFGLEVVEEPAAAATPGAKRAKLHWDAMTLDDGAMSASVWAADAFGGLEDDSDGESEVGARLGFTTFGESDMGRLATLFSHDAARRPARARAEGAGGAEGDAGAITLDGRPVANARVLDPQRSQNLAIVVAPLARAFEGSFAALACGVARLAAAPPRASVEQLETLRGAMPTLEEQRRVHAAVRDGLAAASPEELRRLDAEVEKRARGGDPREPSRAERTVPGALASAWERRVCEDVAVRPHGAAEVFREVQKDARGDRLARLRTAFVVERLAPAEKFVFAVGECERQLRRFAAPDARKGATLDGGAGDGAAARRLDALVTALSAGPALAAVAARADAYADCAAKVMRSRSLAKLLRHVLAAGNAVNAGSSKGGASAVKLASLLAAARTRGADGKTTLLDGVVGLILDRAERRSRRADAGPGEQSPRGAPAAFAADDGDDDGGRHRRHTWGGGRRPSAAASFVAETLRDPYADDLLDFPERDGILAALEAARGADEHAIQGELRKFRGQGLARLEREAREAAREFAPVDDAGASLPPRVVARSHAAFFLGDARATTADECPRAWPASTRDAERRRLLELHERARRQCLATETQALAPLLVQAREIRTYFACGAREPLDSIYATLRDFLRALCESRDAQRRARRARRREADRRAAARARRRSASDLRAALRPTPPAGAPPTCQPRPPQHPPEDDLPNVDHVLARARRQRAAVDGDGDDDAADRLDPRDSGWGDD